MIFPTLAHEKLFHQLTFFILSLNPISYCRFKYINVYIF